MSPLRLLAPTPAILPATGLVCPDVGQLGEQMSTVASKEQRQAILDCRSQYNLGWVKDQSGGGLGSEP